jgi:hypothetical protein
MTELKLKKVNAKLIILPEKVFPLCGSGDA